MEILEMPKTVSNDSLLFILPMLLLSYREVDTNHHFVGCFIKDNNKPELDNNIFILLRKSSSKGFSADFNFLTFLPTYIGYYDFTSKSIDYRIMMYQVPVDFQKEYDLFKLGKYSSFKEVYKRKILDFFGINTNNHKLIHIKYILYKDPVWRKKWEERIGAKIPESLDLHRIPEMENESCC